MYRILFVCAGNICRSPTAEGIMKKLLKEAGLEFDVFVDSAGTSAYHHGDCPDSRAIECADKYGINLRELRSRPVRAEDFSEFDLILAMDDQNVWNLDMKRPQGDSRYDRAQVFKLMDFVPGNETIVPDPYYGNNGFDKVFRMIDEACRNLLVELMENQISSIKNKIC